MLPAAARMADAASAWAHEAERLRARLGAPSPAPGARGFAEATPSGRFSAAGRSGDAELAGSGAQSALSYASSQRVLPGASAVAAWGAAGGGPPPLCGLLRGLQILSDAGAGTTPHGAAAMADATADARRGCVAWLKRSHVARRCYCHFAASAYSPFALNRL